MRIVLVVAALLCVCSGCDMKADAGGGAKVSDDIYTFGRWVVKEGKQEEFVKAWVGLGDYFYALEQAPGRGTLVQSANDPRLYYSFGTWPSEEAVAAMRANPQSKEELDKIIKLCDEAEPGLFKVVAVTDPP